jgi:hypothetical protein
MLRFGELEEDKAKGAKNAYVPLIWAAKRVNKERL